MQRIELTRTAPDSVSAISALPIHPVYLANAPDEAGPEYTVPIVDAASGQSASIRVPYRSTLKKFQAIWSGDIDQIVQGSATLAPPPTYIEGHVTNGTGRQLRNVYIAFHYPTGGTFMNADWLLFIPSWDDGVTLNLSREFNKADDGRDLPLIFTDQNRPDGRRRVRARISADMQSDWQSFWFTGLRGNALTDTFDDSDSPFRRSLPMLSFFERLQPQRNERGNTPSRVDPLRRGGRWLDCSQALAAGQLVVLAEATGPLPMPLEVEGDKVTGEGRIFYQFVLPLDRGAVASTTQPTLDE
jgi:hypothetical protein